MSTKTEDGPCFNCRVGFHSECDLFWESLSESVVPCCCGGEFTLAPALGFEGEAEEGPQWSPLDEYIENFTGKKPLADYADPVSSGRKAAAKDHPIPVGTVCEWAWLAKAGGGVVPIIGCTGRPASDLHHGPDKNTWNNNRGENLHWVCDWCVSADTLLLARDLRWVRADMVREGLELVGFDEALKGAALRPSVVESVRTVTKPTYRITLDDGTVLTSSDNHLWVAGVPTNGHVRWRTSAQLRVGWYLYQLAEPWGVDDTRNGGWLAGMLDGEGWLSPRTLGVGQAYGAVHEKLMKELSGRVTGNLSMTDRTLQKPRHRPFGTIRVTNARDIITLLGSLRPERFMPRSDEVWVGRSAFNGTTKKRVIVSIEQIGITELYSIQTSTKTFVANGILSHNCHNTWHARNDPYYGERPKTADGKVDATIPFMPGVDYLVVPHDARTKANDEEVFDEERRRREVARKHGNLD